MEIKTVIDKTLSELENLHDTLKDQEDELDNELYEIMEYVEDLIVKISNIY